ncbi:HPr family phosphocarrier protein [Moorellaceae bacterium AZ2]
MIEKTIVITNETGLHARPAALFVQEATKFKSKITVSKAGREADAKSILSVIALGAGKGSEITLTAEGEDEKAAIDSLVALIQNITE